jgi:hypothetical protein
MSRRVIQLVHCNKLHRYSITSAQPSSDSGGDNPSAFAVFRLMDQLDGGALDDRRFP